MEEEGNMTVTVDEHRALRDASDELAPIASRLPEDSPVRETLARLGAELGDLAEYLEPQATQD
jgi:hypothetical protein